MILVGILLLTDTISLGKGFLYGALIGILIAGGLFLTTTGKFKFSGWSINGKTNLYGIESWNVKLKMIFLKPKDSIMEFYSESENKKEFNNGKKSTKP